MSKPFFESFESLVKKIATHSNVVEVEYNSQDDVIKRVIVWVHPEDMRNVVGINAKIYRSLKTLIRSSLRDFNIQLTVDVKK